MIDADSWSIEQVVSTGVGNEPVDIAFAEEAGCSFPTICEEAPALRPGAAGILLALLSLSGIVGIQRKQ